MSILKMIFFAIYLQQDATLSQGVARDAAVNFGTYQSFQWHLRTRNSADSEIEDPHRTP